MQYEVSMTVYDWQNSKSKKNTKMAVIQKLHVRITKYLMSIYGGHMCICIPNMKFLCITLCQGGCTQMPMSMPTQDDVDANANDDGQSMIV